MAFNHTLSAILRGVWLVDQQWGDAQMPLVISYLKGENVDFGFKDLSKENRSPTLRIGAGFDGLASRPVFNVPPCADVRGLPQGSIAVIEMAGPMLKEDVMCGGPGMVSMAATITNLSNADNIEGIILNIDSPGGQASGTALLSNAIKEAGIKKPVIAIIDDGMAASAGMWIASSANEIYATQPTDQFGSVGVYTKVADWNKHYKEAMHLDVQEIYAPQSTEKNKDYKDAIAGDTSGIEADLSVLADQFINTVQNNRAGKIKGDKWKTGKMFYAKDAAKIGLIDGIKSFSQVMARMEKLINYPTPSQNKNSNMAFTKTIAAMNAESIEVAEGGFLLSEENLNKIETTLANNEAAAANAVAALETANASTATLTEQLAAGKTEVETLTAAAATSASKITELEATIASNNTASETRIKALEEEIVVLGKNPSGAGSAVVTTEDETVEQVPAGKPTLMDADHPLNQYAASKIAHDKKVKTQKTKF